jgi:hypothetical protein
MTEPVPDTLPVNRLWDERREERRYACQIKVLYSRRGENEKLSRGEATWNIGRIVNVSRNSFGLVLQGCSLPGTALMLEPLLPGWDGKEPMTARVSRVKPGSGPGCFVGCEFLRPITDGELQCLLQNAG